MSRAYRITPRAERDIKEIGRYTLKRWGKEQRNAYILQIEVKVELLAENPDLGRQRNDIRPGFLCFPVGEHLIFYRPHSERIDIIGVLHNRMDPARAFSRS